jgi:hypothetical protein
MEGTSERDERRDTRSAAASDERSTEPAEPMGPLGQPVSEPAPRGTFVLLLVFLLLLIASWVFVYLQVVSRGIS